MLVVLGAMFVVPLLVSYLRSHRKRLKQQSGVPAQKVEFTDTTLRLLNSRHHTLANKYGCPRNFEVELDF